MFCNYCSRHLHEGSRFCAYCGKAVLSGDNILPENIINTDHPGIAREPVAPDNFQPRNFGAERRITTIMFADISGFTSFSETTDPEHLRDLINACFHQLVPIILEHGGQIDKFIGDEIMALFGATQANEDDAKRALTAALRMLEAIKAFSRDNSVSWNLHIGVNTGMVVTGMVGSSSKREFSVVGDTVNIASRLADQAQPGEVLVGKTTCLLTKNDFDFETLQSIELKGKSKPVTIYRLKEQLPSISPGPKHSALRAPLLGRDKEFAALMNLLSRLNDGQPFILWLSGEAGVGKSRLLAEIRSSLDHFSLKWIEGKAVPTGKSISYWPFIQLLRDFFAISDVSGETETVEGIERVMVDLFPDQHQDIMPFICRLMSVGLGTKDEHRLRQMTAENLKFHTYRSVHRLFKAIAGYNPLVLVFEDIHWTDQSTLELIIHILSLLKESKIAVILVERSEESANTLRLKQSIQNNYQDIFHEIKLSLLSRVVSRQLCEKMLKVEEIKMPTVIEKIVSRAGGNPFFLEEMIKALIDMDLISFDSKTNTWKVKEEVQIPETLSAVVLSRLDRMDEGVREIVKHASVVGRSFFYKILQEMINNRDSLDEKLNLLLQMEIFKEKLNKFDREYIFKHALFQKITYESILKQDRKLLHKHAGQIIETLFHDRLDDFFGSLAYHYTQAEEWEKALMFLKKAGEKAGEMGADSEALELYHQTLTAYQRAFGKQIDPFDAAVMQRKMGEALFRKGQHHLAEEYLISALEYYGGTFPRTRVQQLVFFIKNSLRQILNRTVTFGKGSLIPEEQPHKHYEELYHIRKHLGFIYYFSSRKLYVMNILSGLNEMEKGKHGPGMLCSFLAMGLVLDLLGMFSISGRYFHLAGKTMPQTPYDQGYYFHLTGYHEDCRCNWLKAQEFYERSIQLYKEAGEVKMLGTAICSTVELFVRKDGNYSMALDRAVQVRDLGLETGDKQLLAWGLNNIGLVKMLSKQLDEAVIQLFEARSLLASIPDYYILLCCYCHLIDCLILEGDLEKGIDIVRQGDDIIKAHGLIGPFEARFQTKKAEMLIRLYEKNMNRANRSLAYAACRKAFGRSRVFKAFLPETYIHLSRLQSLDSRKKHARTLSKGIALARSQGNKLALKIAERQKTLSGDSSG